MTESDVARIVKAQIRNQLQIILSGESANATTFSEDIQALFPGMTGITQRPVMHPYGFASKAPDGTIQVTARQGDHCGNRMVLGHRASDRPQDLNDGEVVLYNESGQAMYIRDGKIQVGTKASASPMVLGDVMLNFATDLINAFLNAAAVGETAFGPAFLEPSIRIALTQALQKYVTASSTNLVSKLVFTERGGS